MIIIGCGTIIALIVIILILIQIYRWVFIGFAIIFVAIIFTIIYAVKEKNKEEEKIETIFIEKNRKYILEFMQRTNPTINVEKEYTKDELKYLLLIFEEQNINIPCLIKYNRISEEETKLCFLSELVKQEFFIEITKNYIVDFVKRTNPTFNIDKKYSDEELKCLKSILEEKNIKIPCLIKYNKLSDEDTQLCFLNELIKQEVNKQFKILAFGENEK